jgi:hypothetical protein
MGSCHTDEALGTTIIDTRKMAIESDKAINASTTLPERLAPSGEKRAL